MYYISITATDDLYLPFIKRLYREAFPPHEIRDWEQLMNLMESAAEMQVQVILKGKTPVGFIVFWLLGEWIFIEHFAIDPAYRGMKYGESVIMKFTAKAKVLLEVEPPYTEEAIRRIRFYECLGMVLLSLAYQQPSYRKAGLAYEMNLMSNRPENEHKELEQVLLKILKAVYGFHEKSPE